MSKSKRPATAPQPTRVDWTGTRTRRVEYLPSAVVFAQGDAATSVRFVERGVIRLSVVSHAGKEAVVALLDAGHFFGEGAWPDNPCVWPRPRRRRRARSSSSSGRKWPDN